MTSLLSGSTKADQRL